MSIGNPRKFKKLEKLKTVLNDEEQDEISRVHKDKNHKVKKELAFKTDRDKPKPA